MHTYTHIQAHLDIPQLFRQLLQIKQKEFCNDQYDLWSIKRSYFVCVILTCDRGPGTVVFMEGPS